MSPFDTIDPSEHDGIQYSRVLRPHRSSSNRALKIITAFILFLFGPTSLMFLLAGAWPVFGIMGLEIAGLIFALWFNHKLGNAFEAITISPREFRISKVDHWGKRTHWSFQPQWMKVRFDQPSKQLIAGVRGKHVIIGKFLTEEEREALADTLWAEVQRVQLPPHLAAAT